MNNLRFKSLAKAVAATFFVLSCSTTAHADIVRIIEQATTHKNKDFHQVGINEPEWVKNDCYKALLKYNSYFIFNEKDLANTQSNLSQQQSFDAVNFYLEQGKKELKRQTSLLNSKDECALYYLSATPTDRPGNKTYRQWFSASVDNIKKIIKLEQQQHQKIVDQEKAEKEKEAARQAEEARQAYYDAQQEQRERERRDKEDQKREEYLAKQQADFNAFAIKVKKLGYAPIVFSDTIESVLGKLERGQVEPKAVIGHIFRIQDSTQYYISQVMRSRAGEIAVLLNYRYTGEVLLLNATKDDQMPIVHMKLRNMKNKYVVFDGYSYYVSAMGSQVQAPMFSFFHMPTS